MSFNRQTPYGQRPDAPKPGDSRFSPCQGCGGPRYLWEPKSGQYEGQHLICCCKPFSQRLNACMDKETFVPKADMQTGHPIPAWAPAPAPAPALVPAPQQAPLHPDAPDFTSALQAYTAKLHMWCETMQETMTHLAQGQRILQEALVPPQ